MPPARKSTAPKPEKNKSLEQWIWDAACSIRGAKDAPKYKDFILSLIFTKRHCDIFDHEPQQDATAEPTPARSSIARALSLPTLDNPVYYWLIALYLIDQLLLPHETYEIQTTNR